MALTPEQQKAVKEVANLKTQVFNSLKEARELEARGMRIIKRFQKIEKVITDMAKEHGIS